RAHALAVPCGDDLPLHVRLVVEALVAVAHVAEQRRAPEPIGERHDLLGLRTRRLGADRGLGRLLLRLLRDGLLLIELALQSLDLLLGLPERLLQDPEPALCVALRERARRRTDQQEERQTSRD